MKLNVGADMVLDVCQPWPCADGSITEVHAAHVLEHLSDLSAFMVEAYRCMAPGAKLHAAVPHPRHDYYLSDPTHVRPINEHVLQLYDRELCLKWRTEGYSNTPLALMLGVDFCMISATAVADPEYDAMVKDDPERFEWCKRHLNNVISQLEFVLERV